MELILPQLYQKDDTGCLKYQIIHEGNQQNLEILLEISWQFNVNESLFSQVWEPVGCTLPLVDRFLAIHNNSNRITALSQEMLRQLLRFLGADNPGIRKIMLRCGVMMFWFRNYGNLSSSFFISPRNS